LSLTVTGLVPADFDVPATLEHPAFHLRMLAAQDARADYEAVMETQARLRAGSPHGWPREEFTLAENLADLQRHEAEFQQRIAFAFTVVTPADDRVLGCVYINPSASFINSSTENSSISKEADVYMWMRDEVHQALIRSLFEAVDTWLDTCWPFESVNYIRQSYYLQAEPMWQT
jgi:hypothetical protein